MVVRAASCAILLATLVFGLDVVAAPGTGSERTYDVVGPAPIQASEAGTGSAAPAVAASVPVRLRLTVRSTGTIIDVPVDQLTGVRRPDGGWEPVNPPSVTRPAWLTQSAEPAVPSTGTTVLYGHACRGMPCVFDDLDRLAGGEAVEVDTPTARFGYVVTDLIRLPKAGPTSLESRRSDANELLLVTCAYDDHGVSVENLIVVAQLVSVAGAGVSAQPAVGSR